MRDLIRAINENPKSQQVAALAMVMSSCHKVHELAQGGSIQSGLLHGFVQPTLTLNPARMSDLYTSTECLDDALRILELIIQGKNPAKTRSRVEEPLTQAQAAGLKQVIIYTHGALKLRKQLLKDQERLDTLKNRIPIINRYQELQTEDDEFNQTIVAKLAALYVDLFGKLTFRIIVQGAPGPLRDSINVEKIRCLLLSAIRFAVLWYQVGGRQWHFMFMRGKILAETARLRGLIAAAKPTQAQVYKIKP